MFCQAAGIQESHLGLDNPGVQVSCISIVGQLAIDPGPFQCTSNLISFQLAALGRQVARITGLVSFDQGIAIQEATSNTLRK